MRRPKKRRRIYLYLSGRYKLLLRGLALCAVVLAVSLWQVGHYALLYARTVRLSDELREEFFPPIRRKHTFPPRRRPHTPPPTRHPLRPPRRRFFPQTPPLRLSIPLARHSRKPTRRILPCSSATGSAKSDSRMRTSLAG